MKWPTIIRDDESDAEREFARLHRRVLWWRALALFLLAMIVAFMLLDVVFRVL